MLDIEKLLREGKSLEDIGHIVSSELNAAQKKIDAEKVKAAAEKELKGKKEEARKAAIAAARTYYALVYSEFSTEDLEEFAKTAIDSVARSVEIVKKLENGTHVSILDLL